MRHLQLAENYPHMLTGRSTLLQKWTLQIEELGRDTGAGKRRYFRASATSLGLVAARSGSGLLNLVLTPFALRHLGAERFGMWMTITSIAALLAVANLGIDNGMVNIVAAA